jgi:hypothetical protein
MEMVMKTCNEFVKEMRDAGFDFTFKAISDDAVYIGKCENGVIKSSRQLSEKEMKNNIANKLGANK